MMARFKIAHVRTNELPVATDVTSSGRAGAETRSQRRVSGIGDAVSEAYPRGMHRPKQSCFVVTVLQTIASLRCRPRPSSFDPMWAQYEGRPTATVDADDAIVGHVLHLLAKGSRQYKRKAPVSRKLARACMQALSLDVTKQNDVYESFHALCQMFPQVKDLFSVVTSRLHVSTNGDPACTHENSEAQIEFPLRRPPEEVVCEHSATGKCVEEYKAATVPAALFEAYERATKHFPSASHELPADAAASHQCRDIGDMSVNYRLRACIVHCGSYESGHFVAVLRRRGQWYSVNDTDVAQLPKLASGQFSWPDLKDCLAAFGKDLHPRCAVYEMQGDTA